MRRIALNIVSSIALLLTFTFVVVNPAQACSGGVPPGSAPLNYILESPDIVAVGRVDILGERQINGVVRVDYYLLNPQQEGLLLVKQEPLSYIYNSVDENRAYPIRCFYLRPKIDAGRLFVTSLTRSNEGTYDGHILTADENDLFHFPMFEDDYAVRTFTMEELIVYVETRLDSQRVKPAQYVYPHPIRIELITRADERYIVPIDEASPTRLELPTRRDCGFYNNNECTLRLTAPNGIDRFSFYPVGTDVNGMNNGDSYFTFHVEGETGVFSQNSDFVAVWAADQLQILSHDVYSFYTMNSFTTSTDDPLIAGAGAWSPNGRTFAFSTESGVWLWDALIPDYQPELLLAASDETIRVRHYSPLGNYLALESGTRRYHLDMISGREYLDGVFSPDDRYLASYDTFATGLTPLTMYGLPRFESLWHSDYSPEITQFEWITPHRYLYAACGEPWMEYSAGFGEPWCKVFGDSYDRFNNREGRLSWLDGTAFDYDPTTDSLGVVVDADTIWINGEVIELSGLIDGDIVRVELTPLIDLNHTLLEG